MRNRLGQGFSPDNEAMVEEAASAAEGAFTAAEAQRSGTYALTTVTYERRTLFQVERNALLFIETLQRYRREQRYLLHAYVVMPDHVHLLITPVGITIERAVGLIKGGFSHRLDSKRIVWQRSFQDHRCRDAKDFLVHKRYILMNPVRAGLVSRPHLFRFSSAYRREQSLSG